MVSYMPNGVEYGKVLNSVNQVDNLKLVNTMVQSEFVRDKWKKLVDKPFYKPATGIMSILYFIEKYGEVCIHNFDNAKLIIISKPRSHGITTPIGKACLGIR